MTDKKILLLITLTLLIAKIILWFVVHEQSSDFDTLQKNRIELDVKIDSIKVINDAIIKQDSITDIWNILRTVDTYDLSEANSDKLKLGLLDENLKLAVIDSLERSLSISNRLFDSLSPNYSIDFRERLKSSEKQLYKERLSELFDQRSENSSRLKFLEILTVFMSVALAISSVLTIREIIRTWR